jgi:uncharacterized protein YprB with RNaseH-like and TPR domain
MSTAEFDRTLLMPDEANEPVFPARPDSRAERLMRRALADAAPAEERPAKARVSAPVPTRNNSARKAVRARELNKRIRDALREQTEAVYSEASDANAPGADALDNATAEAAPEKKAGSSWEDIANEIAPATVSRRGLATGAARGPSLRDPNAPKAHPVWRQAPAAPRVIACPQPAPSQSLHEALCGEESTDAQGVHYLVSRAAREYDAHFETLRERLDKVLARELFPVLSGTHVEDLLFVDIETTGLSSAAPLFLVGALSMERDARLDLFLARDYPEESALLAAFHRLAAGKTLVTFNGKSFDWPYIEGRSRAHRLSFSAPRAHFDLLHHARRVWKHSLPNCKLQTLELYLCGRTRVDDVPGSQIPRAYHEFVATHAKTGAGAHLMAPILHHNALDFLTTAELLCLAGEE